MEKKISKYTKYIIVYTEIIFFIMCDGISNTDFEREVGGLKKYIALKRPKEYLFMPLII